MTNVLVGILSVILFIGLGLAGASFLGPRFQEAYVSSRAMSLVQMSAQVSMALSLRKLDGEGSFVARQSMSTLQTSGYLISTPLNPFIDKGGHPFRALYSGDLSSSAQLADIVVVALGQSRDVVDVCRALNRQVGLPEAIVDLPESAGSDVRPAATYTSGCFRMHPAGVAGEIAGGDYVAYVRI